MVTYLGSEAEVSLEHTYLLLRTYPSYGRYAYTVHNVRSGFPVGTCDESFASAEEAMQKAEAVASGFLGEAVPVHWRPIRWNT